MTTQRFDPVELDWPPARNFETDFEDWRPAHRRRRLRPMAAETAASRARERGEGEVRVSAGVAALEFRKPEALENTQAFAEAAHVQGLKLSVQVGEYDLLVRSDDGLLPRCEPALNRQEALAAGADSVQAFVPEISVPRSATDELRAKADRIDDELRSRHLFEGQVVTVLDTRYDISAPENEWQEDADWLTGLYCGAMSMAFRATGEERYQTRAREAWSALHELSTVAGVPGVVARSSRSSRPAKLGSGRKRWRESADGSRWWSCDTSRDQLAGHFLGIATYFDLVADEQERETIREDIDAIAKRILEHHMWLPDADGLPCTHANFFVAPLLTLGMLKIAHHVTGSDEYEDRYLDLIDPHFFLGHATRECGHQQDPFFQHYQQDEPLYHLLTYERDPSLLGRYARCLRLLHKDTAQHRNAFHLTEFAVFQPESLCGQEVTRELADFDERLEVARWREDTEALLEAGHPDLDEEIRASLRAALSGSRDGLDPERLFIPMRWRPPMEFGWQYHCFDIPGAHGPHVRYSGVDYLIAFWMGRYHGVL